MMNNLIHCLNSKGFLDFGLPFIIIAFSIFIKIVTRNDKHTTFRKEDIAVGFEVTLASVAVFLTTCVAIAHRLAGPNTPLSGELRDRLGGVSFLVLIWVFGLWGVSTVVRKRGWQGEEKLTIGYGIVVPWLYGLLSLVFAVNWSGV